MFTAARQTERTVDEQQKWEKKVSEDRTPAGFKAVEQSSSAPRSGG